MGCSMPSNSAETAASSSNQSLTDALPRIVDSLTKALKDLPPSFRFGAYFLIVVSLIALTGLICISTDKYKLYVVVIALLEAICFAFFLYALASRQHRLEGITANIKNAADRLFEETDKRVICLQSIKGQLEVMKPNTERLPYSTESKLLKKQILDLEREVLKEIEEIGEYRIAFATANSIEHDIKVSSIYDEIARQP